MSVDPNEMDDEVYRAWIQQRVRDAAPKWCGDPKKVAQFAYVLIAADWLSAPADVVEFMESPWRWANQHDVWTLYGEPYKDDAKWDGCVEMMERVP
jgi:hypothetical protein